MYCKLCGHRADGKAETCPKCGVKLLTTLELAPATAKKLRWRVPVAAVLLALILFVIVPRIFLRTEFEPIGPTTKLRFLRALDHSEYRRVGQRGFRLEGDTLIVLWDLRWNTLPEPKQRDIVRIVGRAWHTVGGVDTRFRIEGEDGSVASYANEEVHLER